MNTLTVNPVQHADILDRQQDLCSPKTARTRATDSPLPSLILHSFRHLGLMFLAPGATYPGIPMRFAYPAALGDFVAAVLAVVAIPAVATQARTGTRPKMRMNPAGGRGSLAYGRGPTRARRGLCAALEQRRTAVRSEALPPAEEMLRWRDS
jgi:hypothetical protein